MCGRYVRKGQPKRVVEAFGIQDGIENWTESFNVAPGSTIPIFTADPLGRHMVPATWGFTSNSKDPLFNARGETVDSLQSFKDSFRQNRCLVPASGFYEWRSRDKQPFYFQRCDGQLLAFAGIWKQVGNRLEATIITTTPNCDMGDVHHRMPVILEPGSWNNWLIGRPQDFEEQKRLLAPSPNNTLTRWPVGRGVGSVRNDSPSLLNRVVEEGYTPDLFASPPLSHQ
jgi:putative SOS response-associated peptidase YedK